MLTCRPILRGATFIAVWARGANDWPSCPVTALCLQGMYGVDALEDLLYDEVDLSGDDDQLDDWTQGWVGGATNSGRGS